MQKYSSYLTSLLFTTIVPKSRNIVLTSPPYYSLLLFSVVTARKRTHAKEETTLLAQLGAYPVSSTPVPSAPVLRPHTQPLVDQKIKTRSPQNNPFYTTFIVPKKPAQTRRKSAQTHPSSCQCVDRLSPVHTYAEPQHQKHRCTA